MVIWKSIVHAYMVKATCGSQIGVAVLSGTSGVFSGGGFCFTVTSLVVGGQYMAYLALVNEWTCGSSLSLFSSSIVDVGIGCWSTGMNGGTSTGAGMSADYLGAIGASVTGLGSRAFWAWVWTPGADSWACKANNSFLRDWICSS